jgi:hypothetical protein
VAELKPDGRGARVGTVLLLRGAERYLAVESEVTVASTSPSCRCLAAGVPVELEATAGDGRSGRSRWRPCQPEGELEMAAEAVAAGGQAGDGAASRSWKPAHAGVDAAHERAWRSQGGADGATASARWRGALPLHVYTCFSC